MNKNGRKALTVKQAADGTFAVMAGSEIIDTYPDHETAEAARQHAISVTFGLRNPVAAGHINRSEYRRTN